MPDLLLCNAVLPTVRGSDPRTNGVSIDGGRIVAVGEAADLRRVHHRREIDLGGRTLLPGFNDAHVHIWKVGALLTTLADLRGVRSFAETQQRLADADRRGDSWVLGRGVNELALAEGRLPTRDDLDAWFPGRPVWVTRTCNHVGIASSAALRLAEIDGSAPDPPGGEVRRDASGRPTGVLTETAMGLVARVTPPPSDAELEAMILAATRRQLSMGVTAATDPGVDDRTLAAYRRLDAAGQLPVRCNVMRLAPHEPTDDAMGDWGPPSVSDFLRVDTAKVFLDGGLSGATAALSLPYRHANTRGVLRYGVDEYAETCGRAGDAGYRVATHVIGDRAIETALAAWERRPDVARSARFEHFGLPTADHLRRTARLGVAVASQAIFLPELGVNFRAYLPDDLPAKPYPYRAVLDAGIDLALSTDAPVVVDERPLAGVAAAVDRLDGDGNAIAPEEAITVREGLEAYTAAGARLSGDGDRFGGIRPGMLADLVVLSESPLDAPIERVADIEIDMTLVGGRVVFERSTAFAYPDRIVGN